MAKSAIYTVNTAQTLASAGAVAVGDVVRRYGCNIHKQGDGLVLNGAGYYDIVAGLTFTPSATGAVSFAAYQNGTQIATATTSGTASEPVTIPLAFIARNFCAMPSAVTFEVSAPGTVSNAGFTAVKL